MAKKSMLVSSVIVVMAMAAIAGMALLGQSCFLPESEVDICPSGRRCPPDWNCAAEQDICIEDGCGDGILDRAAGEECDDGNILPDDGCEPDCRAEWVCGNGVREGPEICDDGNTLGGDGCPPSCGLLPNCGNGVLDPGEECDDGNHVQTDDCPDGPEGICRWAFCGDGFVQDGVEVCEEHVDSDGIPDDTQGCNANCRAPECGDGYWNPMYTDPDTGKTEQCDTGGDTPDCDVDCTLPVCGDGYLNMSVEECKPEVDMDGNVQNTMSCDADCTFAGCGDGFPNPVAGEDCDTGGDTLGCDADCTMVQCGDGHVNKSVEECDDGDNSVSGNCPNCQRARCGDGHKWEGVEVCDPPNNAPWPNHCSADCRSDGSCGNGYVDVDEECDDGDNITTDICPSGPDAECKWAYCGDGHIWLGVEECDDGNEDNSDDCPDDRNNGGMCRWAECGDGHKWEGYEECEVDSDCPATLCDTASCMCF